MEPSLNTWTIIFLLASAQGMFLSAMIFYRKSRINNLLGFLILLFSICLTYYVAFWTRYLSFLPREISLTEGVTYSFGPLLWFYIRSKKKEFYFNIWHFVPQFLYFIFILSLPLIPLEWRSESMFIQAIVQNLHLVTYTALIIHYIRTNRGYTNGALKLYNWRKKVALAFAGYSLSFLGYYVMVWTSIIRIEYDYMVSMAASFFIYFIGYHGFQRQEVFKMYELSKYEANLLPESAAKSILNKAKDWMGGEHKPFLNSSIKLQDLAKDINVSPHYLSQVINEMEEKNFTDFVNEYRIAEAKKLLKEPENKKIIHVAYDSGFNNKVSFNNAFKKFTGVSPSEYRENGIMAV